MKVVISNDPNYRPFDYEQRRLGTLGVDVAFSDFTETAVRRIAVGADILFNLGVPLSRETLDALRACQLIVFWGTGVDCIDVVAATEFGIVVANTPVFTEEVADHTLAMLLMCSRRLVDLDRAVRRVDWNWGSVRHQLHSLSSQVVGIIGMGRIGRAVARRLQPHGCRVVYFDPYVPTAPFDYATPESLEDLLRISDYVTIHAPLTRETAGLVGETQLRLMKPTAYLINAARGGIVEEWALIRALAERRIAGAALDVFAVEPPPEGHPLLMLPDLIFSPHIAGYSVEAIHRLRVTACDAVEQWMRGEWPRYVVNPAVQPRMGLLRSNTSA